MNSDDTRLSDEAYIAAAVKHSELEINHRDDGVSEVIFHGEYSRVHVYLKSTDEVAQAAQARIDAARRITDPMVEAAFEVVGSRFSGEYEKSQICDFLYEAIEAALAVRNA